MKGFWVIMICLVSLNLTGQTTKKGGFIYGWQNYNNNDTSGLGNRIVTFDSTGMQDIVHAPVAGIHPRIYFGPSEIPDIKQRLDSTASGNSVKASLHAHTTLLHLGSSYSQTGSYALDADGERYIDNSGAWNMEPFYTMLKNQDPSVWDNASIKDRHRTATLMSHEAFMCLLYPSDFDTDVNLSYSDRASDLAGAMYFWAQLALADPNVNPTGDNYNNFGGTHMALCYDLMFNHLTAKQQDTIRAALAKIIPDYPRHGGKMVCYANTSNWSTLNSFEIIINLAIENEPGYKQSLTTEWMRAYHNFITYGWYPSGAGYEGLGKNYQFVTTMIACAKRGYSLLPHPHVKSYGENFLPAILQPFGEGFTGYDVWGGSGYDEVKGMYKFNSSDIVGLKWVFPNSSKIDFVWRNYIETFYGNNASGYVYAQIYPDDSYNNYLIPAAIFCLDYNQNSSWQDQANTTIETDYFAPDRGLAVLKSSTAKDATTVQFHARQDMGGHTHGDRLDFTLSALERIWIRKSYGGSPFQPSYFHSMVLIDDQGMGVGDPDGDKCRQPAKILEYNSSTSLSNISADATYAYSWEWHWSPQDFNTDHPWLGNNGWTKVTETWNDFQYQQQSESQYNIPFYDFPHWHQSGKYEKMVKRPYNPMEKVVRNVGLIKGNHPIVLIVDDIKKDDTLRNYKWVAQIARDLIWDSHQINLSEQNYQYDILLREPTQTGNRKLLVRILDCTNLDSLTIPGYIDTLVYENFFNGSPYTPNPNWIRKRLVVESNSVEPNFKVLLFPFIDGQELPQTNWNSTRDTLEIEFSNQNTLIAFEKDTHNNTQFQIVDVVNSLLSYNSAPNFNIFPNPSNGSITISCQMDIIRVELIDIAGRVIKNQVIPSLKDFTVNLTHLPSAVYFVKIVTSNGQNLQKKILIH